MEQFSQLMAVFQSQRRGGKGAKMSEGDFRQTLAAVLGREERDEKIALLCAKVRVVVEVSCNIKPLIGNFHELVQHIEDVLTLPALYLTVDWCGG